MGERYSANIVITLNSKGNGNGSLPGPRIGYKLSIDGGTVTTQGAGTPSLTLYNTVAAVGQLLVTLQCGAQNNISGDGGTVLYPGEFVLASAEGGAPNGTLNVKLSGTLERF